MRDRVATWARDNGIPIRWPEEFAPAPTHAPILSLAEAFEFQRNPCIDYGKFIERIPYFVVVPDRLEQVISAVQFFREQRIPYKTRGAAHSSGGQVLTDRGAILDLSALTGIVKDDPEG